MNISKRSKKILYVASFVSVLAIVYIISVIYFDYKQNGAFTLLNQPEAESDVSLNPLPKGNDRRTPLEEEVVEEEEEESEYDGDSFPEPKPEEEIDVEQLLQTVWIPTWDFTNGLNSLREKNSKFYSISPVWYSVNADGTLVDRRNAHWGSIVAAKGNARLLPSIAISDADLLNSVLSSDANYTTHLNAIVNEVLENDYDGIDIDYEMIYFKDNANFRSFIEDLAKQMRTNDKRLSVTVISQWGDNVVYSSLPETRAVQNYEWVGSVADEVRIMTYDYTPSSAGEAGPIAPITWMEDVLEFAVSKIPNDKIWLGIHLYGYRWSDQGGVHASVYDEISALEYIADYEYIHDKSYEEGVAQYTCPGGGKCTHFFQDPEGVLARKKLAAEYGIAGVAYWRLGGEGDLL